MKRISICGNGLVIDEIKEAAWKRKTSVSRFLIGLFESQKEKKEPVKKIVSGDTVGHAREVFSEIEKKAGVKPVTLFTGGYSKELQVGKK